MLRILLGKRLSCVVLVAFTGLGITGACQCADVATGANGTFSFTDIEVGATHTTLPGLSVSVDLVTLYGAADFAGGFVFTAENVPTGITVSIGSSSTSPVAGTNPGLSTAARATVTAQSFAPDGTYPMKFRAHPVGHPTSDDALVNYSLVVQTILGTRWGFLNSPSSFSLLQGEAASTTIQILRLGYVPAIDLSIEGLPTGVTGAFNPPSDPSSAIGGITSSILTLTAARTAATGPFSLTIKGVGALGSDQTHTQTIPLVITGFSLSLAPSTVNLSVGGTAQTTSVSINRAGYTGTVALAAENLPAGVQASFAPQSTTGNSSVLTLTATGAASPGTYSGANGVTIRGTTPSASPPALRADSSRASITDQTATLTIVIAPASGTAVSVDFSGCSTSNKATWLAYQDGTTGTWTRVTGTNDVYAFNVNQDKVGLAYIVAGAQPGVNVFYMTKAELSAHAPFRTCTAVGTNTVTGTAAGLNAGESGFVSYGSGSAGLTGNNLFQITSAPSGSHDIIGYKNMAGAPAITDKMFRRPSQTIANNGSMGIVDFSGGESFIPANATMTISPPVTGGGNVTHGMFYLTGAACDVAILYTSALVSGNSYTDYGASTGNQGTTDFHRLLATANATGGTGFRTYLESFHTLAPKTIGFGNTLTTPTITALTGGGYLRLQESLTIGAEYGSYVTFVYMTSVGTTHVVNLKATLGWLGGTATILGMPDLSGVSGFDASAPPAVGSGVNWTVTANNVSVPSDCTEGAKTITASRLGTFP